MVNRDEILSWRAATIIMAVATTLTVTTRILGQDPFTDVFDVFIVYLPTAILIGATLLNRRNSSMAADEPMPDRSTQANMAT